MKVKDINTRKQRHIDFFNPESDTDRLIIIDYSEGVPPRPLLWWEYADDRINWAYERYMRKCESIEWLHDDGVPFLSLVTGTEIFAEAFGCSVYRSLNDNPFAIPFVHTPEEAAKIKIPRIEDTKLTILFDMADKLLARAGKDALLGMPDIQTPMDIAALIWDKNDFFPALYDEPEAVFELSQKIREFMFSFFDMWFERYGTEFIAHYPEYYMPYGITVSEDEIGSVNSDMFHKFFEPELIEFSEKYNGIGIHCCANADHQWDGLIKIPNLKMLNLCRDESTTYKSLSKFKGKCGQMPGCGIYREIPAGVHYSEYHYAQTKEQAIDILNNFNKK